MADGRDDDCGCKLGDVAAAYGLEDADEDLVERWTASDGESVRDLAHRFNQRVLDAALAAAGVDHVPAETPTTYRLLTGAAGSEGSRVEKRRQLEREGVDVDALDADFCSHQTVYRHLTDCLGVEHAGPEGDPATRALDGIRALQNRTVRVTEDRLARLAGDALDHDEYRVLVDVTTTCERCGSHYDVGDLLERGGCGCDESPDH